MIAECKGDKKEIQKKAIAYVEQNWKRIARVRFIALLGLGDAYFGLEKRERRKNNIQKLGNAIAYLQNLHSLILSENISPERPSLGKEGLGLVFDEYFFSPFSKNGKKINQTTFTKNSQKKLLKWGQFVKLLEYHIGVFESVRTSLKKRTPKGRPKKIEGLTQFIQEMASLYSACTGKKFTVCEYGDKDYFTEGMRFVQKSLVVIYQDSPFRERTYTTENFENACAYAAKKSLGKK
ncbi:MAG: hypothetical protein EBQ96_09565 [Proteobacteria bacterium]|nr:hypothetical protein [Pseudomonadota bacterium]